MPDQQCCKCDVILAFEKQGFAGLGDEYDSYRFYPKDNTMCKKLKNRKV